MSEYQPDVKVAETYVRKGNQEFQVYTFERSSSVADYGNHRFHETHVYVWDREKRQRGEWIGQHSGDRSVDLHCHVVESVARDGRDYQLANLTTAEALRQWIKVAESLYAWEEIEAERTGHAPFKGPRRSKPEGYEEVASGSGTLEPNEWAALVEATHGR